MQMFGQYIGLVTADFFFGGENNCALNCSFGKTKDPYFNLLSVLL